MATYFILDQQSNTWSETHYPLSSILATPGITENHILANSRTRQTLTVAQAKLLSASKPAAATKLRAKPGSNLGKPTTGTSLNMGTSLNREKGSKLNSHIPLSAIPKKTPGREYKIISQRDPRFNGAFSPQLLNQELNNLAKRGWRVVNMATAPTYTADGTVQQELLVLLERDHSTNGNA